MSRLAFTCQPHFQPSWALLSHWSNQSVTFFHSNLTWISIHGWCRGQIHKLPGQSTLVRLDSWVKWEMRGNMAALWKATELPDIQTNDVGTDVFRTTVIKISACLAYQKALTLCLPTPTTLNVSPNPPLNFSLPLLLSPTCFDPSLFVCRLLYGLVHNLVWPKRGPCLTILFLPYYLPSPQTHNERGKKLWTILRENGPTKWDFEARRKLWHIFKYQSSFWLGNQIHANLTKVTLVFLITFEWL